MMYVMHGGFFCNRCLCRDNPLALIGVPGVNATKEERTLYSGCVRTRSLNEFGFRSVHTQKAGDGFSSQ